MLRSLTAEQSISSQWWNTCLIGESQGSKVIFSCLSFIKASTDGFQLGGFFVFFFCCWKLETLLWWCLLVIPHIFFTFMLLHLIFFLCIELDKWSKRFPGIRNHWCIFKVTFAVLLCCYGIVCTWLHDSSVAKLWIFYTSSKQLWEGRSNWSWAEWRDRKRCPVYGI